MKKLSLILLALSFSSFASLTEQEYKQALQKFKDYYKPKLRQDHGINLMLSTWLTWSRDSYETSTKRVGINLSVDIAPSDARAESMNSDALLIMTCHEIGHHFGGPPYYTEKETSVEGQSDLYATSGCFQDLIREDENQEGPWMNNELARSMCSEVYEDNLDIAICMRTIDGAIHLTKSQANGENVELEDIVHYDKKAPFLIEGHSEPICRLKTYVNGALKKEKPACW